NGTGVAANGSYGSGSFAPTTAGTYWWTATYSGDSNNNGVSSSCGSESVVIAQASPTLTTTPSAGIVLGGTVSDQATVAGGAALGGGSITFKLYGPSSTQSCTGTPVYTQSVGVNGNGSYGSGTFSPTAAGTYWWTASFSGDTNNNAVASTCGQESVTVAKASPTLSTTPSANIVLGASVSDQATLAGAQSVVSGDTIAFNLVRYTLGSPSPTAAQVCAGTGTGFVGTVFTPTVSVSGNGIVGSGTYTPAATGNYYWWANFAGDANNNAASTCTVVAGVTVSKASPTIATTPSAGLTLGGSGGGATISTVATSVIPFAVAVDANGDSLIADVNQDRIWLVAASSCSSNCPYGLSSMTKGSTYTVAGTGAYGFSGDGGPATSASLFGPYGVTVDASNNMLIADEGNNRIRLVAAASCSSGCPYGLASMTKGFIYTVVGSGGGGFSGDGGPASSATLFTPLAVAFDARGDLLIADYNNSRIRLVAAASCSSGCPWGLSSMTQGFIYTVAGSASAGFAGDGGPATSARLDNPRAVAVDPSGDLLVSDSSNYRVRLVAGASCSSGCPFGLASTTKGSIYTVAGTGGSGFSGDGGPATSATLSFPIGVTSDASGDLVIGDYENYRVRLVAASACSSGCPFGLASMTKGSIYTVAGNGNSSPSGDGGPPTSAGIGYPMAVALDAHGNLLIGDVADAQLRKVQAGGSALSDQATLAGGVSLSGGSITFNLYGPSSSADCTGAPVYSQAASVTGNGPYTSGSYTPTAAGTYWWTASFAGDGNNNAVASSCGTESAVVAKASPTISTTASSGVTLGAGSVSDQATLAGGVSLGGGSVTFNLYGPSSSAVCTGTPAYTQTTSVSGNGSVGSGNFTPTAAGTYWWTASFGGDANNNSAASACGAASVTVAKATPTLSTTSPANIVLGGVVSDAATLAGTQSVVTGDSITFRLYGPSATANCAAAISTQSVNVAADGSYISPVFTPPAAGTYWWTASFSGDANNNTITTSCGAESVAVAKASPTLANTPSPGIPLGGGTLSDTATIAAGVGLGGGTLTLKVIRYALGSATPTGAQVCAAGPVYSVFVHGVTHNGDYVSGSYTPLATGNYYWVALFNGDANNNAVDTCATLSEVTVSPASPTLTTTASAPVALGAGSLSDQATLAGGVGLGGGSITFDLYGPSATADCSGLPVYTSTSGGISANGNVGSGSFSPTAAGTYWWTASFGGDSNNNGAATNCGDESVTVSPASPTLTTTASPTIVLGGTVGDLATLAGGFSLASDSITFNLYGPAVFADCTGTPVDTETVSGVSSNGVYPSPNFTPTAAGTYWWTASFSGDGNNNAAATTCGLDSVVVQLATPTLTSTASNGIVLGAGTVNDQATLAGGVSLSGGSILFSLYGPSATADCTGTPVYTNTAPVSGNGNFGSGDFTPLDAGTYWWTASFSGDGNNNPVTTNCGDASVAVAKATPSISTVSDPIALGSNGGDAAAVLGAQSPLGGDTVTFDVYGPSPTADCTGTPVYTQIAPVAIGRHKPGASPVVRASSGHFAPTAAGTYWWTASFSGDANNNAASTSCGDESVAVPPASPTLANTPSGDIVLGGTVSDTAALAGTQFLTGGDAITFALYGPSIKEDCTNQVFAQTVDVAADGSYASTAFTPTAAGRYWWAASFNGDANNNPAATNCADGSVVVSKASPTISTTASAPIVLGNSLSDTGTLAGGVDLGGGAIEFNLYGPSATADCSGLPLYTSTVGGIASNGDVSSGSFSPTAAGTYWWTASFGGDANNNGVTTNCGDESVVVSPASPTLTTTASGPIVLGGTVGDLATLAGGLDFASDSITFNLYGPSLFANCSNAPVYTQTVGGVSANGVYASANFTPTAVGTYWWTASFGGDGNNNPAATSCGGASVVVSPASPTLATVASAGVVLGAGSANDQATLAGAQDLLAGDAVTFDLYGPSASASCSGSPVYTQTVPVSANGSFGSGSFTPVAAGTYWWTAALAGDANNNGAATTCGDASVLVSKATPTLSGNPSAAIVLGGGTVSDQASLAGAQQLLSGDAMTFSLYGPSTSANCSGNPVYTQTVPVSANGSFGSGSFTPAAAGTYWWTAAYTGDANNNGATTSCNAEPVVVSPASPTLSTVASAGTVLGGAVSDTATLAAAQHLLNGDAITLSLYGPSASASCSGSPVYARTLSATSNGTYGSGSFTPVAAGKYWWTASLAGDTNNNAVATNCGDASVVVSPASPTLSTTPSGTIVLASGTVSDQATLAGAQDLLNGDSITFKLYGPSASAVCTGTPVYTASAAVSANGAYSSPSFFPGAAGTYWWTASFNGDSNNNAAVSGCGAESVVVSQTTPTLTTAPTPAIVLGSGTVSDLATLAGGANLGLDSITFNLYGPSTFAVCTGTPVYTQTVSGVTGNGLYSTTPFTPLSAGTYWWTASYSGDSNNHAAVSGCGAESVTVAADSPTLGTTPSGTVALAGTVSDAAALTGAHSILGGDTVAFSLYGPSATALCTGAPVYISSGNVTTSGTAASGSFVPAAAGTYWWTASFAGDVNNNAAASACGSEKVVVSPASPTITTSSSGGIALGGTVSDSSGLAGSVNLTGAGTVTFNLYGPSATAVCTGTPVYTKTLSAVSTNGPFASGAYAPVSTGTYWWTATFSGDANNNTAATACGSEFVTVIPANANQTVGAGQTLQLSGGTLHGTVTVQPGGTLLLNGGTLTGQVNATGGTVNVSSGSLNGNVQLSSGATLNLSGGTIAGNVQGQDTSGVSITGGSVQGNVQTQIGPVTVGSGATVTGNVQTQGGSINVGGSVSGDVQFNAPGNSTACATVALASSASVAGNVSVQNLPSCGSSSVSVSGSIGKDVKLQQVAAGGSVTIANAAVGGQVQLQQVTASSVSVTGVTGSKDLTLNQVGAVNGPIVVGNNKIAGQIQIQENNTSVPGLTVNGNTAGNGLSVQQVTSTGTLSVQNDTLTGGNLQVQNVSAPGITVNGNQLTGNNQNLTVMQSTSSGSPLSVSNNSLGGQLQVQNDTAPAALVNANTAGQLTVQQITVSSAAVQVEHNTVGGQAQVQQNAWSPTKTAAAVIVAANTVGGNLSCKNDTGPATDLVSGTPTPNTVTGQKQNECATL
ncbi:MAG: hypothetical protein JO064_06020, partial [Actinobacteria bacterium]|nr:hypothetical protein [Actinomycetota bacterium]